MNDRREELDPLDEAVLRRSLRLEPDERAPRLDEAALVAAAVRRAPWLAIGASAIAVSVTALVAASVWTILAMFAPALLADAFDAALATLAQVAVPVAGIVETAQAPVVPASILAALAVAIFFELRHGRETQHAVAS